MIEYEIIEAVFCGRKAKRTGLRILAVQNGAVRVGLGSE